LTADYVNDKIGKAQIAYKSWWPTHAVWISAACGLNLGYWSEQCEMWYQERLSEINKGNAQPLSTTLWRKAIKSVATGRHVKLYSEKMLANNLQFFV
jgi:hypothetical protein